MAIAATVHGKWDLDVNVPVARRVSRDLAQQVGWYASGATSRFDPGELATGLALLARCDEVEADVLLTECVRVLGRTQSADGAWPTTKVISQAGGKLLHVASYEIGLALAMILERRLMQGRDRDALEILTILERLVRLAEQSYVPKSSTSEPFHGWGNDRARHGDEVESWTSSVVLMLFCVTRKALLVLQDSMVLRRLGAEPRQDPKRDVWDSAEPIESRKERARKSLRRVSDPTKGGGIRDALFERFVEPVLDSGCERPSENAASFVLPGPPGTRKTSLCRALATALDWPLVTLTPALFLQDGIDGVERNADRVFRELGLLRRAVVLFDECEDLFRSRPVVAGSSASRTAGAFITAGMLPRLQGLRDAHWVIFALAFNGTMEDIDAAVIRPGRFDFKVNMGNPTPSAQRRYLMESLDAENLPAALNDAISELNEEAGRELATTSLTWTHLDRAAKLFESYVDEADGPSADVVAAELRNFSSDGPPDLSE